MSLKIILILMISIQINGDFVDWNPASHLDTNSEHLQTCSKTTLDFPKVLQTRVLLNGEYSVNSIAFPLYGELVLDEAVIYFGEDKEDINCTKEVTHFVEKNSFSWNDADVWSSDRFNKATPDAERMPCSYDTVRLNDSRLTSVELPNKVQYVKDFSYDYLDYNEHRHYLKHTYDSILDVYAAMFLNKNDKLGIKIKKTSCKPLECVCQENQLDVNCSLKNCPKLFCENAIQPIGDCCQICGSSTVIDIDPKCNITQIAELVKEIIDSYSEDLVYHIGRISKDKIQIVVVDRLVYTAATAEVANEIAYKMKGMLHINGILTLNSGIPLTKRGLGAKIAFSVLFLVTLVLGAVYLYYYEMPQISFPFFAGRHFAHTFGVSRFQRRTESVVALTRRDSTVFSAPINTAFSNPLYESTKVQSNDDDDAQS